MSGLLSLLLHCCNTKVFHPLCSWNTEGIIECIYPDCHNFSPFLTPFPSSSSCSKIKASSSRKIVFFLQVLLPRSRKIYKDFKNSLINRVVHARLQVLFPHHCFLKAVYSHSQSCSMDFFYHVYSYTALLKWKV